MNSLEVLETDCWPIRLRRSRPDRTNAHITRTLVTSEHTLFERMRRSSIDLIRAPEPAHIRDTDIILTRVNPISIDESSNIEVIIYEKWHAKFFGKFFRFVRSRKNL